MYELHQKKKLVQSSLVSRNSSLSNNQEITKCSTQTTNSTVPRKNNLYFNMIPGEILKPQPLNNNTGSSVHSVCDMPKCDMKNTKVNASINPKEFENDDSSPFDNVELQTIDEIKELNNVFQALNTKKEEIKSSYNQNIQYSTQHNVSSNSTSVENHYSPIVYYPSASSSTTNCVQTNVYKTQPTLLNNIQLNNNVYSPIHAQHQVTNHYQSNLYKTPDPNHYNNSNIPFLNNQNSFQTPFMYANASNYPQHEVTLSSEMKRSLSEKKNLSHFPEYTLHNVDNNSTLRSSKSFSDLTQISKTNPEHMESTNINTPDRSKTPPTLVASQSKTDQNNKTKNAISLPDPYHSLSEQEKKFVDNLCQMGFKRDRVSRTVKHIPIDDDKKIFEYLLALQQFEDQGYDCYESEVALHMNNYNKLQVNFSSTL